VREDCEAGPEPLHSERIITLVSQSIVVPLASRAVPSLSHASGFSTG
jgi:hypothetical protein